MIELGELEGHHEEFVRRNTRVLVVSLEGRDDAAQTQTRFPHLTAVTDADAGLIKAAGTLHAGAAPGGRDAAAPMTVLIDRRGIVRWLFRPDRYVERLSPEELLAAVDRELAP